LVGIPEGKRPVGRASRRWLNNIKIELGEIVSVGMDWINLSQDRDQWRALVNTVVIHLFPSNLGGILSICTSAA
jgi:hypothetical protein